MIFLRKKVWLVILILLISIVPAVEVTQAQEDLPEGPIYIIQDGDTLWEIAQRFGIPWEELARVNDISDPGQLQCWG